MNEVNEWSCSEWIETDMLFIPYGRYLYHVRTDQLVERFRDAVQIIADAFKKIAELLGEFIADTLPDIMDALEESDQTMEPRHRRKPVRYICTVDRVTDRRLPVYHNRNALPNMRKNRKKG